MVVKFGKKIAPYLHLKHEPWRQGQNRQIVETKSLGRKYHTVKPVVIKFQCV